MKFFVIVETVPLTIYIIFDSIQIIKTMSPNTIKDDLYFKLYTIEHIAWSLYSLLQTYGMIKLKDSKDPL